jgi:hypothetical protein
MSRNVKWEYQNVIRFLRQRRQRVSAKVQIFNMQCDVIMFPLQQIDDSAMTMLKQNNKNLRGEKDLKWRCSNNHAESTDPKKI